MSTPQDPAGLNPPPYGGYGTDSGSGPTQYTPAGSPSGFTSSVPQPSPYAAGAPDYAAPTYAASAPAYTAADFPAPAGVQPVMSYAAAPVAPPVAPAVVRAAPRRRAATLLAAAGLSAVIGAGAGIGGFEYANQSSAQTSSSAAPVSVTTVPAAQTPVLNGTVAAAAAAIEPSVVTITVQSGQSGDIGTGVVLDAKGDILTNNHVVAAAAQQGTITVTNHDGTVHKATLVGTSVTNDLAVIKVASTAGLIPAKFAKSSTVQVGEGVVAAGAPLGLSETITSGIVSNTARPVRSGSNDDAVYLAVQTDTAINPGNSGGPLVDLNGSVVGINSSIASTGSSSDSSSQSGSIGIGFAIPSDVAVRVAGELVAQGKSTNAAMGVTVQGSDSSMSTTDTGVPLQTVVSGGAADKVGLVAGDVVTKVNDFKTTSADGLIAATRFYAPGTTVRVTYTHSGREHTVEVTLGHS